MFGFCKCGGLLIPEKGELVCRKCGAKRAQRVAAGTHNVLKLERNTKEVPVIENDEAMLPTMERECGKCGNPISYFWVIQTRASDEPPTRFFRCTKCKHTWREYS